ncbi:uncharacterized protein LOC113374036 isoform X1 [Ctenocephalides felis]|uniref:uncharacterized protein LOC113374036 isoform X1 n=1 Tax=Ctenocephalides felis TaxID=7515 RepID=UPI000E6E2CA9|nr:uncharacterized protein LOC113374036 isoform X1 [Ctenocephalides felis]XP_026470073.1 uncharacterized protein LOC113374036 isoform X1 [Ctenocephalides felis]XP_026470074.1 uncharacterized protein LOC113374036 isoform X1 [Ctenocephalides felis]
MKSSQQLLLCTHIPSPGIFPESFYQVISTTTALHTDSFTRNLSRNILPGPFNYCCSAHCLLHQESFQKHFTRSFQLLLLCKLTPSPGILPETFYQVLSTTAALQTDSFTRNPSRNILPVLSTTAALHTDSLNQESFQKHFTRSSQSNYYCPVAPNIKSLEYSFMCMTRKCFFFSLTAYNYA